MGSASFLKRAQALLRIRNQLARECLAELLAVFVLIVSGAGGWAGAERRAVAGAGGPRAPLPVPHLGGGGVWGYLMSGLTLSSLLLGS